MILINLLRRYKICSRCKRIKLKTQFREDKTCRDGFRFQCKTCMYEKDRIHDRYFPEKRLASQKRWIDRNRIKINAYQSRYYLAHKQEINTKKKLRMHFDHKYRLSQRIAKAISQCLSARSQKWHWEDLVHYRIEELKAHLQTLFQPGMTWSNYGQWHVDHRIPICAFNFSSPQDAGFKQCWALDNLQPLWAKQNLKKGGNIPR